MQAKGRLAQLNGVYICGTHKKIAPQDERIILAALEEVKKVGRPASDGPGDRGNEDRKS